MQVYLNGKILPIEEAKISPMDRSFLFGDGVYEVIPFFDKRPFELKAHLERLQRSLDGIYLPNPYSIDEWQKIIEQVVEVSQYSDLALYLQISRGEYSKRDHVFPEHLKPTIFIAPFELHRPTERILTEGIEVVTTEDQRWFHCNLKTTSLLGNLLARCVSAKIDASETIMIRDGYVTEASAANIFVVKDNQVLIVPDDNLILRGITYSIIESLLAENNIAFQKRKITKDELINADEVWLSSSTKMVIPVTKIDGKIIKNGKAGPAFQTISKLIWQYQSR